MRLFSMSAFVILAIAFLVQGCQDLTAVESFPSADVSAVNKSLTSGFNVDPGTVAFAVLADRGVFEAFEMTEDGWVSDGGLSAWDYLLSPEFLAKNGGDPPANPPADPWDTVTENFGRDTNHKPKPKSNDPPPADPWDTINEKFFKNSNHPAGSNSGKSLFDEVLAEVPGDHSAGELLLLAAVIQFDIGSPGELQDVFNRALNCCVDVAAGSYADLFFAPSIEMESGLYFVLSSAGNVVELEAADGNVTTLLTLGSDQFVAGSSVEADVIGQDVSWSLML